MARFEAARITSGMVRDTGQAADSAQFAASELLLEMVGDERLVRSIRTPVRYQSFTPVTATPAPPLDAHRDAVLAEISTAAALDAEPAT
jgi:crotonobetainyl-CoA:carnitine CoA-transferase CaiB-like acyl-CoA transferase